MVYRYPREVHDFVREHAPKMRDRDLAEACNRALGTQFTASSMKSFRSNHGYRNGQKQWTKEEYWKYQTHYPQGMYEFVRDNSWGTSSKEMARMVNERFGTDFSPTMMKQFRQRHGIKSGVTGWYQKGHAPGNKGKKLEEYVTDPERLAEVRKRIAPTQFKKGNPSRVFPVGTVMVNSDGYKLVKVQTEGTLRERWRFLHREVWKEHNGPIPEGLVVIFKDGDRLNCDISNLALVTKGESAALTGFRYRFQDPDLTMAALSLVRLRNIAKEKRSKRREEVE